MRVAERHGLDIHFVSNAFMRLPEGPLIHRVVVADGPDAADDWIAERIEARDIAVTADIPLAARCLKKGAAVIGPTGKPFTEAGIGMALAMRELSQHLRETGESKGYNASFTKQDRSRFLEALELAVRRARGLVARVNRDEEVRGKARHGHLDGADVEAPLDAGAVLVQRTRRLIGRQWHLDGNADAVLAAHQAVAPDGMRLRPHRRRCATPWCDRPSRRWSSATSGARRRSALRVRRLPAYWR